MSNYVDVMAPDVSPTRQSASFRVHVALPPGGEREDLLDALEPTGWSLAVSDDVPAAMTGTWYDVIEGTVTRRD